VSTDLTEKSRRQILVGVTEVLDKGIHREIREMVLSQIPREMHPWSSHEGQRDITLYRLVGDQRVQVAEPDIPYLFLAPWHVPVHFGL
jgi:hypothetical protein